MERGSSDHCFEKLQLSDRGDMGLSWNASNIWTCPRFQSSQLDVPTDKPYIQTDCRLDVPQDISLWICCCGIWQPDAPGLQTGRFLLVCGEILTRDPGICATLLLPWHGEEPVRFVCETCPTPRANSREISPLSAGNQSHHQIRVFPWKSPYLHKEGEVSTYVHRCCQEQCGCSETH